MISVLRKQWLAIVFAGFGVWTMVYLGLYGFAWTDYDFEASPSYSALVGGHVWRFFQLLPAYGGSLEMRAPFALLPGLWGGGEQSVFQAVGIPCLIAGALLGVWLYARVREQGASPLARWTALALCAANPITMYACELGHPEELLGAVLCVAAVLLAQRGRVFCAALLLGLAVANKEWALLAVGPVLLALPAHRWRALAIATATAAVFYAPMMLAQLTNHVTLASATATSTGVVFQPWQIWWFLGASGHVVRDTGNVVLVGYRVPPGWLSNVAHPLIVILGLPLTLLAGYRGRRAGGADALLLLAGLLLMRCVLDPWDTVYYPLGFLIALVAWESVTLSRPPLLGLLATFATWVIFEELPPHLTPDAQSGVFLVVALPALTAMAIALWRPRRETLGLMRLLTRDLRRHPAAVPQVSDR
jgi:hypothetical protein